MSRWRLGICVLALTNIAGTAPSFAQAARSDTASRAEPGEIQLPSAAKAQAGKTETWSTEKDLRTVRNVTQPTLTPFLPKNGRGNGTAVIIAPGGGFMSLAMDAEGYQVARWLADNGVAAFVLKYRLEPTPDSRADFTRYAVTVFMGGAKSVGALIERGTPAATEDAVNAMHLVRSRASEWKIDPRRIGFMGFSAGAFTTMGVALQSDNAARPDFVAPIYGSWSRPTQSLPRRLPPMWAALSSDDPLFGKTDFGLIAAWRDGGGAVEAHYYNKGGHGWGFTGATGTTTVNWRDQFLLWLDARGFLTHR